MDHGRVTGVTIPHAREHSMRPMLDRLLVGAPWLLRLALGLVARLPPTSRLRTRVLRESLSRAFAAMNRGDLWFLPFTYEPDCEIHFLDTGFRTFGLADSYRADGGWREATFAIRDEVPDARWVPEHLIDLGDRWVLRAQLSGSGRSSGARTNQTWGCIYHLSPRSRIARQHIYWTWEETLAAAGLKPGNRP
jgi:hypothetical protein